MSAIAERLKAWNYTVTGSDLNQSKITDNLNAHGIKTTIVVNDEPSDERITSVVAPIILFTKELDFFSEIHL